MTKYYKWTGTYDDATLLYKLEEDDKMYYYDTDSCTWLRSSYSDYTKAFRSMSLERSGELKELTEEEVFLEIL